MKLSDASRIEIMSLVLHGLATATDISEKIRELDFVEEKGMLALSDEYIKTHPREIDWSENN